MRRLVLFVLRARVIEVGQLVERELAIAFRVSDQISFRTAVSRQILQLLHSRIAGCRLIAISDAASSSNLLKTGVNHAAPESLFETLVEVAHFPKFLFDPTVFNPCLKLSQHCG